MSDVIQIQDLEVFARIGQTEKERQCPQRILLNLRLVIDGSKAARTKELADSVCYQTLSNHVRELVSYRDWVLVEELAHSIADNCLAKFELLQELAVEVKKFVLPATSFVSFTTTKSRLE